MDSLLQIEQARSIPVGGSFPTNPLGGHLLVILQIVLQEQCAK